MGLPLDFEREGTVLTYIRNRWGNAAPAVSADEVAKARRPLVERTD